MLARCGQSALYLVPEPYQLLRLTSKRGPEYPLYFRAVWPFGLHGGTFRRCEEWARLGLCFGCGSGGGGAGAAFGSGLGRLAQRAEVSAPPGRGLGLGRGCSGAGLGAGFGALPF